MIHIIHKVMMMHTRDIHIMIHIMIHKVMMMHTHDIHIMIHKMMMMH